MEKNYITPQVKVRKVEFESLLLDNSLNQNKPTSGLPGNDPTSGGTATGGRAGDAGSKYNVWGEDEE
jgi:glutamate formiminotransferase